MNILHLANENEFVSNLQLSILRLQNPYQNVFYWVKGEIIDCLAMQQAISTRLGNNIQILNKTKGKMNGFILEREKLMVGKKSLKTLFKSTKETEAYATNLDKSIANSEASFEHWL